MYDHGIIFSTLPEGQLRTDQDCPLECRASGESTGSAASGDSIRKPKHTCGFRPSKRSKRRLHPSGYGTPCAVVFAPAVLLMKASCTTATSATSCDLGRLSYILGYICTWDGTQWKSGCRDIYWHRAVSHGWRHAEPGSVCRVIVARRQPFADHDAPYAVPPATALILMLHAYPISVRRALSSWTVRACRKVRRSS
jgi:hypothetical protein